jgi:hypothetical protein
LFGRYEKERDKYPTLAEFMPEIVKMHNEIVTDEYIAEMQKQEDSRPKVVATNPPNGAKGVDPSITEISITFDRPMMDGVGWNTKGRTIPERSDDSPPVWSDDKRTCTISDFVLKPGTEYRFWLNPEEGEGFRSADGVLLKLFRYTFATQAERQ